MLVWTGEVPRMVLHFRGFFAGVSLVGASTIYPNRLIISCWFLYIEASFVLDWLLPHLSQELYLPLRFVLSSGLPRRYSRQGLAFAFPCLNCVSSLLVGSPRYSFFSRTRDCGTLLFLRQVVRFSSLVLVHEPETMPYVQHPITCDRSLDPLELSPGQWITLFVVLANFPKSQSFYFALF